jgi:hypothetical protein
MHCFVGGGDMDYAVRNVAEKSGGQVANFDSIASIFPCLKF